MAKKSNHHVVSANRLLDGEVVYFTEAGEWSDSLNVARVESGPEAAAQMLEQAQLRPDLVVGPYLVGVEFDEDGLPSPVHMRETMRVSGPTVARQHARA